MSIKSLAYKLLFTGTLVICGLSQAASATTTVVPCATLSSPTNVMSCATGLAVSLSVLNTVVVNVLPVDNVFGTAPQPYMKKATLTSFDSVTTPLLGTLTVHTNVITDTASSTYTGAISTLSATATSTVNGLSIALGIPAVIVTPAISTLKITAKTLTSTSTASKINGGKLLVVNGSSQIENLAISGVDFASITLNGIVTPSVNDYLVDLIGLKVIANYQTPIYLDGTDKIGIQTAALAILFKDYAFNGGLLNGTILIADSAASVPELATWAMMLIGFGLVGAVARQRHQSLALA